MKRTASPSPAQQIHGIPIFVKNSPELDDGFVPAFAFLAAYAESVTRGQPVALVVERRSGLTARRDITVHGTPDRRDADALYASLISDAMLWQVGGPTLYVCGSDAIADELRKLYSPAGARAFDYDFMGRQANRQPMEVIGLPYAAAPASTTSTMPVRPTATGRCVGIDLGGSDIKYAATIDGDVVASDEIVWHPKQNADPAYHFAWIVKAIGLAAAALDDRVDHVSFSSAGDFDGQTVAVSSLFKAVPEDVMDAWRDILPRAAREVCGPLPVAVANDGDVSAFAGFMTLGRGEVLGLAFGTSLACGYVDAAGGLLGWTSGDEFRAFINEMAFVIGDLDPDAPLDVNWSGKPCYSQLLSQDAAVRLAEVAGIERASADIAEQLAHIQSLAERQDERALRVFRSIGAYLAHAVPHFDDIYAGRIAAILLLGRVVSGVGGQLLLETASAILADEYPRLAERIALVLPNGDFRRKGQAVYASFLHL